MRTDVLNIKKEGLFKITHKEAVASFNTWTNEFNDRITFMGCRNDKGSYTISINDEYIKATDGLNTAKAHINKFRNKKCEWSGSIE